MSVINRKPFIKTVLDSLAIDELADLLNLVDGGRGDSISRTPLTIDEDDMGVHRCQLAIKEGLFTGYLLFSADVCALVFYADKQSLGIIEIEDGDYKFIDEPLSITDLRLELGKAGAVHDIKDINSNILDALKCGDIIVKTDSTGGHAYLVTYKKEKVGICLTYLDASTVETQSYDYDEDTGTWVYNSEDKASLS